MERVISSNEDACKENYFGLDCEKNKGKLSINKRKQAKWRLTFFIIIFFLNILKF